MLKHQCYFQKDRIIMLIRGKELFSEGNKDCFPWILSPLVGKKADEGEIFLKDN